MDSSNMLSCPAIPYLMRDAADNQRLPTLPGVTLRPSESSLLKWHATIDGPAHSPYAGGKFVVEIQIPKNYPLAAPSVYFKTKTYHMNIDDKMQGEVCIKALDSWSSSLRVRDVVIALQAMLRTPELDFPMSASAAGMYRINRAFYDTQARQFTARYGMSDDHLTYVSGAGVQSASTTSTPTTTGTVSTQVMRGSSSWPPPGSHHFTFSVPRSTGQQQASASRAGASSAGSAPVQPVSTPGQGPSTAPVPGASSHKNRKRKRGGAATGDDQQKGKKRAQ